ncbi:MAG: 2-oxoglutarate dehydrogenase complex dihydrolipoyllysine-residue succinyltransferase [Bdellovibrionota bacterium]
MAKVDVKVPGVGESVQEGMIESWHKSSGDWVEVDDVLLELETDKATVEVTSEASGVLEIITEAGAVVKVGEVIARIDTDASKPEGKSTQPSTSAVSAESSSGVDREKKTETAGKTDTEKLSPAVRRMVAEGEGNLDSVVGTGRGGRVTKADLIMQGNQNAVSSTPASNAAQGATSQTDTKSITQQSKFSLERAETRKPMSMLRRRIAERLIESQRTAAILTTFNEVDMSGILDIRKKYKDKFFEKHAVKLGFMGFFLKASVEALREFPAVNAYIEGTDILYHNYCDIGVAVSTQKGLMVPIIRNVDKMELFEVELAIADFANKARDNKISMEDLSGGTFTVSNGGVFGSLLSTPILNPPQSAILGMHKTQMRPMVMPDGSIAARPMMYLALSYDHRIIDGKEAVSFLVKVKECLEDPSRILLGV